MFDPFQDQNEKQSRQPLQTNQFPHFDTKWPAQFDEGIRTKTGKNLEKGSDFLKKASGFYIYGLGLTALLIILPAIVRFLYEFSSWAYKAVGKIFP